MRHRGRLRLIRTRGPTWARDHRLRAHGRHGCNAARRRRRHRRDGRGRRRARPVCAGDRPCGRSMAHRARRCRRPKRRELDHGRGEALGQQRRRHGRPPSHCRTLLEAIQDDRPGTKHDQRERHITQPDRTRKVDNRSRTVEPPSRPALSSHRRRRLECVMDGRRVLGPEVLRVQRSCRLGIDIVVTASPTTPAARATGRTPERDQFLPRPEPIARKGHDVVLRPPLSAAHIWFSRFHGFPALFRPS
jgi:hypothetical protein